ncbi:MAG: DUF420 domain-containing protein [Terriglobales bacterium]
MWGWNALPGWIASLNLLSAGLLIAGFVCIKRKQVRAHRAFMISAFAVSAAFLTVYLLDHFHNGIVYYKGQGWWQGVYFSVLGTHSLLAAAVPFLAVITLVLALRSRFARHRQWARWTWPIWMYVSVTGVAVYWMLYRG